jgi:uncharacterized short protein YbdD (DUF466 family)
MKRRLSSLWLFLRALATDDSYDRYLAHHAHSHPHRAPLDRREFYLKEQQRKWTGVSRCC